MTWHGEEKSLNNFRFALENNLISCAAVTWVKRTDCRIIWVAAQSGEKRFVKTQMKAAQEKKKLTETNLSRFPKMLHNAHALTHNRLPTAGSDVFPPLRHHGRICSGQPSKLIRCGNTYTETNLKQVKESSTKDRPNQQNTVLGPRDHPG